jgi:hypothetical protein
MLLARSRAAFWRSGFCMSRTNELRLWHWLGTQTEQVLQDHNKQVHRTQSDWPMVAGLR